ncbi:hypothetical protein BRADI_3g01419v3 [Brachypodium distachyon]|uniref:F-box domain-containing protein n=1 Tax=Brachypodium distachyon TaxID=15368 RepID=A0A0Q3HHF8_BRADI|nr:hypothetical protein BRADI_3g01419v3 [Brachypodium distachyon]
MESLPLPEELLAEIFLRLPTPADLGRASAVSASFRRVASDCSFLRAYRKRHAPPLLGFLDALGVFHQAAPPHPSAPAARAVALAADFSFSFLPASARRWAVQDVRDGRVLLDCCRGRKKGADDDEWGGIPFISTGETPSGWSPSPFVFTEMVVCDPLHRRYLLLPPIPNDLAAAVEHPLGNRMTTDRWCEAFLVPSNDEENETSFRVIWMVQCATKLVAFVFSSSTGQWRAIPSRDWKGFLDSLPSVTSMGFFSCRQYAYGCFYWLTMLCEKLLVLDTRRMEFSMADRPPVLRNPHFLNVDIAIGEVGGGITGMFVLAPDSRHTSDLSYITRPNNDESSSSQWSQQEKICSMGSECMLVGSTGRYLFIDHGGRGFLPSDAGISSLDVKTFQHQRVCASENGIPQPRAYMNFPPPLSSPRLSSGIEEEILGQGSELLPTEGPKDGNHNDSDADDADTGCREVCRGLEMALIEVILQTSTVEHRCKTRQCQWDS